MFLDGFRWLHVLYQSRQFIDFIQVLSGSWVTSSPNRQRSLAYKSPSLSLHVRLYDFTPQGNSSLSPWGKLSTPKARLGVFMSSRTPLVNVSDDQVVCPFFQVPAEPDHPNLNIPFCSGRRLRPLLLVPTFYRASVVLPTSCFVSFSWLSLNHAQLPNILDLNRVDSSQP